MKRFRVFACLAAAWLLLLSSTLVAQVPQGSAFTYQGELLHNGAPVTANVDMLFTLFDAPQNGSPLGQVPFTGASAVTVSNGIFTVTLDFAGLFNTLISDQRWLEVTANGNILTPRTQIQSAPYALQSQTAVLAYSISNASVGAAQIVPSQVQARVGGTCTVGSSIRAIAQNGTVTCESAGSGTVTNIATDATLSGGPITSTGTLGIASGAVGTTQINPAQVQQRVNGSCSGNQMVKSINADGTVSCGSAGTGTVTNIATDATLAGGPISTSGTLGIAPGGVGLAQIDTSQVQARTTGTCDPGFYMRVVNADGSVTCEQEQVTTIPPIGYSPRITSYWGKLASLPSMAFGSDGFPVISYTAVVNSKHVVIVAKCTEAACLAPILTTVYDPGSTSVVFGGSSIVVGSDGLPLVSFAVPNAGGAPFYTVKCSNVACTATSAVSVLTQTSSITAPVLLVDASLNRYYIVYVDSSNNLRRATCSGSCTSLSGGIDTLVTGVGSIFAATIDHATVYYAYTNSTGAYFYNCTSGCSPTAIATPNASPPLLSMLNASGSILVAFRNAAGKLAVRSMSPLLPAQVALASSNVTAISAALVGTQSPVLAYSQDNLIKVVDCSFSSCNFGGSNVGSTLDGLANATFAVGRGSDGLAVAAYADGNELRVAKCVGACP
ncbi:hypothetical protein ELE36_06135 [Pseudolysobacter antarcticus]|uniref:Uncharacterized protein n=1 Tax=Pseudolysobacter antarcticus TaxID=2511995 RepID=A0A411HHJ8_9GAMM|nr:hypothetical protein [Pseudolysobacter antarcticus]QBB69973.1 hypothetical protein ELE36_06135 [Pseudolysobacter antarcticus]